VVVLQVGVAGGASVAVYPSVNHKVFELPVLMLLGFVARGCEMLAVSHCIKLLIADF